MKTITFGLTGGIASGKSTVSRAFAERGVTVVDADLIARLVVRPGMPALRDIVEAFGAEILLPDGNMDRKKVGALVFGDPAKRAILDSRIGPWLRYACFLEIEKKRQEGSRVICFDAPLLVESGMQDEFRPVVVVACKVETQIARMKSRNGFTEEEAKARLAAQLPIDERLKHADFVIPTDNTMDETRALAFQVLDRILETVGIEWP